MLRSSLLCARIQSSASSLRAFGFNVEGYRPINSIGVIGSGQMGMGIALTAAVVAKLPVRVIDVNQTQLDKQLKFAESLLAKDVTKGKITAEESQAARSRLIGSTNYADVS